MVWTWSAASSLAAAVRDADTNDRLAGARISVCATSLTARLTCPPPTLAVMIAHRLAASRAPTIRARAHGPRPPPPSVSASVRGMNIGSAAQLLPHHVGHDLAIRAALGLRRQLAHDTAHVGRRRSAGLSDGSADELRQLCLRELLGQELGDDRRLLFLHLDHRVATGGLEMLDGLAPLLHLLAEHVDDVLVGQLAAELDAAILIGGHRHAQRPRAPNVAREHGLTHGGLDPLLEGHRFTVA